MYKILVVDDEKWIRKGIICQLEETSYDFSWLGEAENGEKALEIIKNQNPHIVITDIRMNNMDGIQLIEEALKICPDIKFIIVSGYAEFTYAEQALNMGVSGYLLKPIKDDNFSNTLSKVIKELECKKQNELVAAEKTILEKSHSLYKKELVINKILHNCTEPKSQLYQEDLRSLEREDNFKHILIAIHIDSSNYQNSGFQYQDLELIKFALKNILNEICEQNKYKGAIIADNHKDKNQILILLSQEHGPLLKKRADEFAVESFTKISKYLNLSVTIAVSEIGEVIAADLYKQIKDMLDLRFIHGSCNIYKFDTYKEIAKYQMPEHKIKILQNCIELNDIKNTEVVLRDIFSPRSMEGATGLEIRLIYLEIINILLKLCNKMGLSHHNRLNSSILSGDILDSFNNSEDIVRYMFTTIIDIFKMDDALVCDYKNTVPKIKEHIETHYMEELTVKDLAHKFAINPDYLSTLYKREVGISIIKHVNKVRVENACKLLVGTSLNMTEIAKGIGYQDVQYFYKVFKRVTGKTPVEYRKENHI